MSQQGGFIGMLEQKRWLEKEQGEQEEGTVLTACGYLALGVLIGGFVTVWVFVSAGLFKFVFF